MESDTRGDSGGSAERVGQEWDQGWCFLSPATRGSRLRMARSTQGLLWVLEKPDGTGLGSPRGDGRGG